MAKSGGMGDRLYLGGFDLSGDVGSIQTINGGHPSVLQVTGISSSGVERLLAQRSGEITFNSFWNDAAGGAHVVLDDLPRTDVGVTYFHGHALGLATASMTALQVDYNPVRGPDGSLVATTQALSNHTGLGLVWGGMLTNGQETDTTGTNPTSGWDDLAGSPTSTDFGATMWVHLITFTGSNITFTLRDAATEPTYAAVTGGASAAMTAVGYQMWSTGATQNIRRYLTVGTSGTFSNAVFVVGVARHRTAVI